MSAPSVDVKDLLEAAGVGTMGARKGWGIYIGREPAKPLNVLTIFDTGGRKPEMLLDKTIKNQGDSGPFDGTVESVGIQIRVRSSEYETSYSKAQEIFNNLANTGSFISLDGEYKYLNVYPQSNPLPIGEDDKTRHIFSLNFMAIRTPIV